MADKTGYIGRNPADSTVRITRQVNTVVGVQTTFSFSSQYDIGFLDVYLNGVRLVNAVDYTATDGSNVEIYTPTSDGDTVEFVAYKAFNVAEANPTGDGSRLTGIVTSIAAGDNIEISPSSGTGTVTITGLANTANVSADTIVVTGFSTFGQLSAETIDVSGVSRLVGLVSVTDMNVNGSLSTVDINSTGIITATSFSGDGSELQGLNFFEPDITTSLFG